MKAKRPRYKLGQLVKMSVMNALGALTLGELLSLSPSLSATWK